MIERVPIASEDRSLGELEGVIERGLATFVDVGIALLEIRDKWRIFRHEAGYDDFDAYCRERWGFSRSRANRLIEAAEVVNNIAPIGANISSSNSLPQNEAQVRELARIPDTEARARVWQEVTAAHGEKVTAAHIRQAIEPTPIPHPDMLPIIDLETGEIVDEADDRPDPSGTESRSVWAMPVPDIRRPSDEEAVYDQIVRMGGVTKYSPADVAAAGYRYRQPNSVRMYLSQAEAILAWHQDFVRELTKQLNDPIRRVK